MRLVSLFLLLLLAACSELGNGTGQISQRIGELARNPETKQIRLAELTTFGWDHFFIFKPGTKREEICEFIGADRSNCGRVIRYESVPQTHVTLVFGLGRQLTHTELHALANGRFDLPPTKEGYSKESAIFKVRRALSGTEQESWLEPQ
jgi:hypothetical protein